MEEYLAFLDVKTSISGDHGFKPTFLPDQMFDFQKYLVEWATKKGRCAIFADCGLGKSLMELSWAQNVVNHTGGNVLLLTPLAVGTQMEREGEKFGIEAKRARDGNIPCRITITNYEQLHKYNPADFDGVVCDESSILKNFDGQIKHMINIFCRKIKYRLLATATAAPNDFIELGTSSEALGYLGYMDMLSKFFKNDQNNCATNRAGRFTEATKWRLKGHAHDAFWRWVVGWSRAIRKPSDIGFSDEKYALPELRVVDHELDFIGRPEDWCLFRLPAVGLKEQRDERRATVNERCEKAAQLANESRDFCVVWCNLNDEGDLLEKLIPDAIQVSGRDSDDAKEEKLSAFSTGKNRVIVIKPKIGAWGLNWQHCNHMVYFPTHSFEQYYQSVRRCWRFGQKRPVTVDMVFTKGDENVISNMIRKRQQCEEMFCKLVDHMNEAISIDNRTKFSQKTISPSWM